MAVSAPNAPCEQRSKSGDIADDFLAGSDEPFFVLPTHLPCGGVPAVQRSLADLGIAITEEVLRARSILTAVRGQRRIALELRIQGADITSDLESDYRSSATAIREAEEQSRVKRRRIASVDFVREQGKLENPSSGTSPQGQLSLGSGLVSVVKYDWLTEWCKTRTRPSLNPYVIFKGKLSAHLIPSPHLPQTSQSLLDESRLESHQQESTLPSRENRGLQHGSQQPHVKPVLLPESTEEHEAATLQHDMPEWVRKHQIYACQRVTLHPCANQGFVEQLKKIRLARLLTGDEIGVRAYSTSIASVAAFPREFVSSHEVLAVPGCDKKTARLYQDYREHGHLLAADEVKRDPDLKIIESFYEIWGVGAKTAREFFYDRGWRDTDDIIMFGWSSLTRVQQIGLKYLEELEKPIPRSESDLIASIVTYHARQLVDEGIESIIVGGYRRGKQESGDVDVILTHRRTSATQDLITPLVKALEDAEWITHTLTLTETNSARQQETLPMKTSGEAGGGFDTLDKALLVWQDPSWPTRAADLAADPQTKNPNLHRRVDIIIAPWRTVGCAITGWTSGTTFQRDLRRYAKHVKGWKFDSSGIRDRTTGRWIDIERWTSAAERAQTWQEAERRVFEGLGLTWREPWERCTE